MPNLKQSIWYGILSIIVLIGIYSMYIQFTEGHEVTGASDFVPWGIYIAAFAFFVGASAGATIIGFLIHAFGREDYKRLGIRAVIIGILSLAAAILFVMVDVGHPLRMLKIPWLLNNTSSMFFISSTSYYLFMALLLVELYYLVKIANNKASEKERTISKWLAIIAVPYALLVVHMVTGLIFGVIKSREYWNTSILPIHFIIAALATGTALVILAATFSSRIEQRNQLLLSNSALNHAGILLASFIVITLLVDLSDMIVLKYSDKPDGIEVWKILTEQHTLIFALNIICLPVALLITAFKKGRTANWLVVASMLVLVGIGAYRYNLVIAPQKVALLPGMEEIHYTPTAIEISVTTGIIAFTMIVYWLSLKWKPIRLALEHEGKTETKNHTQKEEIEFAKTPA